MVGFDPNWLRRVNQKMKETREKQVEGDPQDAAQVFAQNKQKAQNGDVKAMKTVGNAYYDGRGVRQDYEEAVRWFKKAAERGSSAAMYSLGRMYYYGEGVNEDNSKAFNWFLKAVETDNDGDSMNMLGLMYWKGHGVGENDAEAVRWMKRAIEVGNSYAMSNLGYWYLRGSGSVIKNIPEGMKLMVKAIEAGNMRAAEKYGDFWLLEYQIQKAAICYKLAAENDNADAACKMGCIVGEYKMTDEVRLTNEQRNPNYWISKARQLGCNIDKVKADYEKMLSPTNDCFITTAVCAADGKPDDCYELTTFRAFRDDWLVNQPDGRSLIDEYYRIAPSIVAKINQLPEPSKVYRSIRAEYLEPCLSFIEQGKNVECKNLYVRMVNLLRKSFL